MKMKIGVLIVSAAIIATAGIAFARDSGGNDEPAAAAAPMAPQGSRSRSALASDSPFGRVYRFIGGPKTVELRPRVGGTIDAVSVPEGSMVRQGQLLFQIDPRPFRWLLTARKHDSSRQKRWLSGQSRF
ncbi:biotin/lipoyl-binding protein [Klebsiella pneumoniae]|uniref:biotin/lipoyl-binding protein n=1 Tax=Klebsiella pneumoniae TaxID=573 RepID=UPI00388EFF15